MDVFHYYPDMVTLHSAYDLFESSPQYQSLDEDQLSDLRCEKERDIKFLLDGYNHDSGKTVLLNYLISTNKLKQKDFMKDFPAPKKARNGGVQKKQKASKNAQWHELSDEQKAVLCNLWNSYDSGDQACYLDQITRLVIERYHVSTDSVSGHESLYICTDKNFEDWPKHVDDSDSGDDAENSSALITATTGCASMVDKVVTSQGTPSIDTAVDDEEEQEVVVLLNTEDCSDVARWVKAVEECTTGPALRQLINELPMGSKKDGKSCTSTRVIKWLKVQKLLDKDFPTFSAFSIKGKHQETLDRVIDSLGVLGKEIEFTAIKNAIKLVLVTEIIEDANSDGGVTTNRVINRTALYAHLRADARLFPIWAKIHDTVSSQDKPASLESTPGLKGNKEILYGQLISAAELPELAYSNR